MTEINGWRIFAHPLFLGQLDNLTAAVARAQAKDPKGFQGSANAKLLAALRKLMLETIPSDPTRAEFRQGGTLGPARKHWFRAKFGGQRFQLFFRWNAAAKVIIVGWVDDSGTLRTYGSKTDAYSVFRAMLDRGDPPDDWDALVRASPPLSPDEERRLGEL